MKYRKHVVTTALLMCAAIFFSNANSVGTAKPLLPSLWQLASDRDGTHAKMIRLDVSQQRVVQEIPFPPDLIVGSAQWSPDLKSLAAIIGLKPPYSSDDLQVCIFSPTGELEWCAKTQILAFPYSDRPAPTLWSANSEHLFVVSPGETNTSARVQGLDVKHRKADISIDIDIPAAEDSYINEWHWLPEGQGAGIGIYDANKGIFETYAVWFSPKVEYSALTPAESWSLAWSDNSTRIAFATKIGTGTLPGEIKSAIRIADFNGRVLSSVHSVPVPQYEGNSLDISDISWSHSGDYLAFSALPTYKVTGSVHRFVFVQKANTGQLTKLYQVPPETETREGFDYRINQLTWSPDDGYLAARLCIGVLSNGCSKIIILSTTGQVIEIDSGTADNRDPMWLP